MNWLFDETKFLGIDFNSEEEAKNYDKRMSQLRDIEKEAEDIATAINLERNHTILDFGAGTGEFAIRAAKKCKKVIAVDISSSMLDLAEKKARKQKITNIQFIQSGFLTYQHKDEPLDAIVTQLVMHYLPGFWKMVALKKINAMLKNGGSFYLKDVVFHMDVKDFKDSINNWISETMKKGGVIFEKRCSTHIKEENSTIDWIMKEMLKS